MLLSAIYLSSGIKCCFSWRYRHPLAPFLLAQPCCCSKSPMAGIEVVFPRSVLSSPLAGTPFFRNEASQVTFVIRKRSLFHLQHLDKLDLISTLKWLQTITKTGKWSLTKDASNNYFTLFRINFNTINWHLDPHPLQYPSITESEYLNPPLPSISGSRPHQNYRSHTLKSPTGTANQWARKSINPCILISKYTKSIDLFPHVSWAYGLHPPTPQHFPNLPKPLLNVYTTTHPLPPHQTK